MKITEFLKLLTPAANDVIVGVDVSEDITKKIELQDLPVSNATQSAIDAKQDTLVSGTNIKTINSTSLLGSGDVAVQQTLVSGTNIKTLNSESLLGSGNIEITASPAGVAGAIQFSDGSAFASDASNLFWDDTNNRLGIGTNAPAYGLDVSQNISGNLFARMENTNSGGFGLLLRAGAGASTYTMQWSNYLGVGGGRLYPDGVYIGEQTAPSARLHVKGSGTTSATTSLLVQNSSGTDVLKVTDDGSATANSFKTTVLTINSNQIFSTVGIKLRNTSSSNGGTAVSTADAAPANTMLYVKGFGTTSATTSLLVQNSDGTQLFKINDNRDVFLGSSTNYIHQGIFFQGDYHGVGNWNFGTASNLGARLGIKGSGSTSATIALLMQNSAGTQLLRVKDDGQVQLGPSSNFTVDGGSTYNRYELVVGALSSVPSAILSATSTTKGFLPPRMTTTQKNAISSPASGLMVYDTDLNQMSYYNGTSWVNI